MYGILKLMGVMLLAPLAWALNGDGGGDGGKGDPATAGGDGSGKSSGDPALGDGGKGDPATTDPGKDGLTDGGKAAIDAERKRAEKAEADLRKLQKRIEEEERAKLSDHEREVREAEDRGRVSAKKEMLKMLAAERLKAHGSAKMSIKPERIPALFNLDDFIEGEELKGDSDFTAAIEALIKEEPHLAARPTPGTPGPDGFAGSPTTPNRNALGGVIRTAWEKVGR